MKTNSQSGFAIAAIIGIIAVLALLGGTAYVATHNKAKTEMENATTTQEDAMEANGGADLGLDGGVDVNVGATTSLDTSVGATTSVGAGAGVNVGGAMPIKDGTGGGLKGGIGY